MKIVTFLIFIFITFNSFANELKISVAPLKPAVNEVFQVTFRIFTDSDDDPQIKFSPDNLEVIGRGNQGISTRTIYANGKLSVTREINVTYEILGKKTGTSFLRDIRVTLDDKTLTHPVVPITILKQAEESPDIFLKADVPKSELYVGEGLVVRYYLYSKGPVNSVDIKKYPKLNNFLKRYLQEAERSERVSFNGEVYLRTQIYAAKLFPEKVGEFKVDPLSITATYSSLRSGDPFGAFGFNRSYKTKSLSSEPIKVIALPLPTPIPEGFVGLVGKHSFELQFGKNRLIVNEPLEVKLTISGVGALENLEAPQVLKHPSFEEFETNGDLKIANSDVATKIFTYTFLPKDNAKIPGFQKLFYYFDADLKKYEAVPLNFPEIEVAGAKIVESRDSKVTTPELMKKKDSDDESLRIDSKFTDFNLIQSRISFKNFIPYMNIALATIAFLLLIVPIILKAKVRNFFNSDNIPKEFKKGHFDLSHFLKWITPLTEDSGKTPILLIQASDLSEDAKNYFISIIRDSESSQFSKEKIVFKFVYNPKHFKNLDKYIKSLKNASNT